MTRSTLADALGFSHLAGLRRAGKGESAVDAAESDRTGEPQDGTSASDASGSGENRVSEPDGTDAENAGSVADEAAAEARGAARERARCAAIFGDPAAARNIQLAAKLAFGEANVSAEQAIEILKAGSSSGGLAARMEGMKNPDLGPLGTAEAGRGAVAASWDATMKNVNG